MPAGFRHVANDTKKLLQNKKAANGSFFCFAMTKGRSGAPTPHPAYTCIVMMSR